MAPPLLALQSIHLKLGGGGPLLDGADISVGAGERICLVGRNGSGKSTLLKIAAGLQTAFEGKRFMQPGATIRYLAQEPDFAGFATVWAYVEAGLGPGDDPYRGPVFAGAGRADRRGGAGTPIGWRGKAGDAGPRPGPCPGSAAAR